MNRRKVARQRRVEKDATSNLDIAALYAAATKRYGSAVFAASRLEGIAAEFEQMAYLPSRPTNIEFDTTLPEISTGAMYFLRSISEEIWLEEEDRPYYEDLARLLAQVSVRMRENRPLIRCESHGWIEPYWHGLGQCAECPCHLPSYRPSPHLDPGGRRQIYCSDACRQRAYRRRLKERKAAEQPSSGEP